MKMAVGFMKNDSKADLNSDGYVDSADARIRLRQEDGVEKASVGSSTALIAESILNSLIENSTSYSYDVKTDPLYMELSEFYKNESKKNAEDIFGLAASLTGGYGNSYGLTLAKNALQEGDEKTAEKAAELEEKAYERYQDKNESLYKLLEALYEEEDRETADEKASLDFALEAADKGDFSYLEKLGIDTSALYSDIAREEAEFFAKYGDTSLLGELGVDLSKMEEEEKIELAELFAKYKDYSLLSLLGADTSKKEEEDKYDLLTLIKKYGKL